MTIIDNAKTALLFPPLSFLKNAPFLTMFSQIVKNNVLVTYPITLYTREKGKMRWLGFLYASLYTGRDGKRTTSISFPLCFENQYKQLVYKRLLREVDELAVAFKASCIKYEGYSNIRGEIISPLSSMVCGNTENADFLEFVSGKGFSPKAVHPCYQVQPPRGTPHKKVFTIPDFSKRRREYLHILSLSDFPQLFDMQELLQEPRGIMDKYYFKEEWILFAESQDEKGCCRWIPSLFGDCAKAKIVRLAFCNASSQFVHAVLPEMLKKIGVQGIDQIQIGDVANTTVEGALKELGGHKVYDTVTMVKYY